MERRPEQWVRNSARWKSPVLVHAISGGVNLIRIAPKHIAVLAATGVYANGTWLRCRKWNLFDYLYYSTCTDTALKINDGEICADLLHLKLYSFCWIIHTDWHRIRNINLNKILCTVLLRWNKQTIKAQTRLRQQETKKIMSRSLAKNRFHPEMSLSVVRVRRWSKFCKFLPLISQTWSWEKYEILAVVVVCM